jgi:Holliday junction resolvase RusA-like endonuclease
MKHNNSTALSSQSIMLDLFGLEEIKIKRVSSIISQTGWTVIKIQPMPAPRPRASTIPDGFSDKGCPKYRAHIYNPANYTKYKAMLAELIRYSPIKADDYNQVEIIVGIALKKSYSKKDKERLIYTLHHKKPDFDNYEKGIMDAIQQSGKIKNDSLFGSGSTEKIWIGEHEKEFVMFNLIKRIAPVRDFRKLMENATVIGTESKRSAIYSYDLS